MTHQLLSYLLSTDGKQQAILTVYPPEQDYVSVMAYEGLASVLVASLMRLEHPLLQSAQRLTNKQLVQILDGKPITGDIRKFVGLQGIEFSLVASNDWGSEFSDLCSFVLNSDGYQKVEGRSGSVIEFR